jgi:hypothetical protein
MYFSKFPSTNFLKDDGTLTQVKDIIRRVVFTDESFFNESNFQEYYVRDGETPDLIAQKFYDDPRLGWVVILYNTAFDPFYSFPLSRVSFDKFMTKKYGGQSLFLSSVDDSFPYFNSGFGLEDGDLLTTTRTVTPYPSVPTRTIEKFNNETLSGQVKRIDNSLSKIELFNQVGEFTAGETIARRKTIQDKFRAKISKVTPARYAVHHFESDSKILNPLGGTPDSDGFQDALDVINVRIQDTILYNHVFEGIDTYVVTNDQYESTLNEAKRNIRVPNSKVVGTVADAFEKLIKEG